MFAQLILLAIKMKCALLLLPESSHEQRSLSTSMAQGQSWLPREKDAGVSGNETDSWLEEVQDCADIRHQGEVSVNKQGEINKAKVRRVLKVLRSVKCDNFRVVGAGDWGKWGKRKRAA